MTQSISDLFEIEYGHSLSLNKLTQTSPSEGVAFVSRTARNNGVSAWVEPVPELKPLPAGLMTVCLRSRNHALSTFIQPRPFYCGYHVFVMRPRYEMTLQEKMWWSQCIEANRYRFNFGRQANRSFSNIQVPDEVPQWVREAAFPDYQTSQPGALSSLHTEYWKEFSLSDIFHLQRGERFVQRDLKPGKTPYIRASALNNGVSSWVDMAPMFPGGTITISSNGSVGESFYQPIPFVASDDIVTLTPKTKMSASACLFFVTVVLAEKYRFNYGRKWFSNRMKDHKVRLPVNASGAPDWGFAAKYMESFPLSQAVFGSAPVSDLNRSDAEG
ncbi:restriction endonuclease subunit S [Streptomyces sp. MBT56]|uniref:restriction endonuclease subunit S n=1 Tax=unclassified Streptomyces TaxID=2593676 RepID=UPI00190DE8B4|nr:MULTISPECIES: restriction endonuclease subunit S [unclassified Streptomyces]MBK3560501.1 restriction endonuclease subunit S [Streptomyces sp. MBT56]MBK3600165.1 restriction endonuclease subunit S [Streptomyces sp. MBT54]MBK3613522.1 restriction endonuclease subunit S [Streptomyces sp. MBT98]